MVVIGLAVVLVLGAAFAVLRIKFEGEDLGDNIASLLNKRMRGRIEIGSIEWDTSSLKQVVTGGWVPLTMRDVRVWDDCALSASVTGDDRMALLQGDPNEDCTPDDRPDPDPASKRKPRKLLLRTDLITGEVDIHALMFGNHDFVFRNVWVHGGEALLEETLEPYPLHAYDRTIVSIVTAFYPRQKAGFRAGIYADAPPPTFDIRDIHVENLNLTVHMNPYTPASADKESATVGANEQRIAYVTTARLEDVDVDVQPDANGQLKNDSYLYMDPSDPLVAKFYVRLNVAASRGRVRVFDEGPRGSFRLPYTGTSPVSEVYPPQGRASEYEVELRDIKLNRLAQLPTEWARKDYVANTLELDLEARTLPCKTPDDMAPDPKLGAAIHLTGELHNYWDRPYDGSWNLKLDAKNLGPTIRSCIKSTIGGDNLEGTISLTGPFVASPAIGLDLKNLDFDIPLRANEEPLRLTLTEVHGKIDLVNEQGYIDQTKALIRGGKEPGEVTLAATFGLKPYNAHANIDIVKPIDVGRFLPPKVATSVGRFLHGRLRANGDAEVGFALDDFDLSLSKTASVLAKDRAFRVYKGRLFTDDDFDSIQIQKVMVEAGRSRAEFDGYVDVAKNDMKIRIEGNFPDLDEWMRKFELPALFKSAGGGVIIIQGPLNKPKINVMAELGGVPCIDRLRITSSTVEGDNLDARFTTAGLGGQVTGTLRMRLGKNGSNPYIERLHLDGKRIDAAKLCGLGGIVKGTLDTVEADLVGAYVDKTKTPVEWITDARVYAKAERLTVLEDRYDTVNICLNRPDDNVCRPRKAYLDADDLSQCATAKRGGFCAVASATRVGGGVVDATVAHLPATRSGRTVIPAKLGGTIALSDLPLQVLEPFIGKQMLGGIASATLHLQGSPKAPQADGRLTLLRSWALGTFVGDSQISVRPTTVPAKNGVMAGIAFSGQMLAGRLQISGTVGSQAPYPVELALTARRVELDVLLDLTKRLGLPEPLQLWASGSITVKTELEPVVPIEPEAWVELTELRATYTHRAADGRLQQLLLEGLCRTDSNGQCLPEKTAAAPLKLSLRMTPTTIELACKDPAAPGGSVLCGAKLDTPAGPIQIAGRATPQLVDLRANGTLSLPLLEPLVDTMFSRLDGQAELTAQVGGTFEKPTYEAALRLVNVVAQPIGGDTVLEAPTGLVKLANGSLGFNNVRVQVRDQHRDEAGELHVKGNITLDGLTPVGWGLLIGGDGVVAGRVAGKMLLVAAPKAVSQASGLARIEGDIQLSGKGPRPTVSGTIVFDPPPLCPDGTRRAADNPDGRLIVDGQECRLATDPVRSLALIPRGVRRELAFTRGSIDIETESSGDHRTYKLAISDVHGTIDGEGTLDRINGNVELRDGVLTKLDVSLAANDIPFRVPGTLDLVLSARGVRISKGSEHATLEVRGNISIIDGKYVRNFALTDQIVSIGNTSPPTKPFWEEYPTIGNANLMLTLDVRRFAVDNNIANIDLVGPLIEITNTPRDPRLSGSIRVQRGTFRIPGTRARFTRTAGSIDFAENQKAGDPVLDITSDAPDFRDLSGQDHVITLAITGSLEKLQWDLRTSTGYNKSQTLSLLVLGRNAEQLRRSLGDQSLGADPTRVDPSTNPSQGFADQIVKDLAGDWVSGLLGDSLSRLTGLDVLRIEIGFGSIGFHVEKKVADNVNLLGQTEQTIRGSTINVRGEIKTPYPVSGQAGYLNKNFNDPAEQDIEDWSAKLVYRVFIR